MNPIAMTPEKILLAKKLVAQGQQWSWIERKIGHCEQTIREAIDPAYRHRRLAKIQERRERMGYKSERIPDRVDERDVHRNPKYDPRRDGPRYHETIGAELFGDPVPGRSALDQKLGRAIA